MVGMRVDTREKPDASVDTSDVGSEMPDGRSDGIAAPVEAVDEESEPADEDEADDGDGAGVGDGGVWEGDGSDGGGSGGDVDGTAVEVEEEGGDEEKE
jgi:hypothetical protein